MKMLTECQVKIVKNEIENENQVCLTESELVNDLFLSIEVHKLVQDEQLWADEGEWFCDVKYTDDYTSSLETIKTVFERSINDEIKRAKELLEGAKERSLTDEEKKDLDLYQVQILETKKNAVKLTQAKDRLIDLFKSDYSKEDRHLFMEIGNDLIKKGENLSVSSHVLAENEKVMQHYIDNNRKKTLVEFLTDKFEEITHPTQQKEKKQSAVRANKLRNR